VTGFTLLEMIVVMAILGVVTSVIYTCFRGSTSSWTTGDARSQRCQNARAVLEIMGRDLKQAITKSATDLEFYGVDATWTDTEVTPSVLRAADGVYFTASSNYPNAAADYDLEEVGYYLDTGNRYICRMENDTIDSDLTDGTGTELGLHVIGLNLRYHDGASWSDAYAQSETLPTAVEITLTVEDEDQIESPRNFKTIVYIP